MGHPTLYALMLALLAVVHFSKAGYPLAFNESTCDTYKLAISNTKI
jgi:hypothetical protein